MYYNRSNPTFCTVCFSASAKLAEDKAAYFSLLQTMLNRLQEARYVGGSSEQTDNCIIYKRGNTDTDRQTETERKERQGQTDRDRHREVERQTDRQTDR